MERKGQMKKKKKMGGGEGRVKERHKKCEKKGREKGKVHFRENAKKKNRPVTGKKAKL